MSQETPVKQKTQDATAKAQAASRKRKTNAKSDLPPQTGAVATTKPAPKSSLAASPAVGTTTKTPAAAAPAPVKKPATPTKKSAAPAKKPTAPAKKTAVEARKSSVPAKEKPASPTAKPATAAVKSKTPVATVATDAGKPARQKKPSTAKSKLVRDSFTLPETDYARFAILKQRALSAGVEVKKSELVRAGLALLAGADDAKFLEAVGLVERIKTGRPKK